MKGLNCYYCAFSFSWPTTSRAQLPLMVDSIIFLIITLQWVGLLILLQHRCLPPWSSISSLDPLSIFCSNASVATENSFGPNAEPSLTGVPNTILKGLFSDGSGQHWWFLTMKHCDLSAQTVWYFWGSYGCAQKYAWAAAHSLASSCSPFMTLASVTSLYLVLTA